MQEKKYIAPSITVVTFRAEHGYASSLTDPLQQQIDLMLMMQDDASGDYTDGIQNMTMTDHEGWLRNSDDDSFWN